MLVITDLLGRAHPLVLHIPIGALIYTYIHWSYNFMRGQKAVKTDFTVPLTIGFLGAVASSISGWILAGSGGYNAETLMWHKYLGIGTAVSALLLLMLYKMRLNDKIFGLVFTIFMGLMTVAGHFGGTLTHGEGFITKPIHQEEKNEIENVAEAHVFNDLVMPIFERKCVACHNPNKSKGNLLFHDLNGWQKGGKNGAVLIVGVPSESNILKRAHLPVSDELHMPPNGKLQLTNGEIKLLEWWVTYMKNYDHKVKDLPQTPQLTKYLESIRKDKYEGVEMPNTADLLNLQSHGIYAELPFDKEPIIDVSFKMGTDISKALKSLKRYNNNIYKLDLTNSNAEDEHLKKISEFKNLRILRLTNTRVTDRGLRNLKALDKLSYLNVYGTQVTDEVFGTLDMLENLKEVYVWQTKITEPVADKWRLDHPNVYLDYGVDMTIFGTPKLASPMIESETELFVDSLAVSLKTNNVKATIHYSITINGESENYTYEEPFTVTKTAEIAAFLTQEGWANSDTSSRTFLKTGYKIASAQISPTPSDRYLGDGPTPLINLIKGTETFSDGRWVGIEGADAEVTLDLGDVKPVESVVVGTLEDANSYIFSAQGVTVSTSSDGINFTNFGQRIIGKPKPNSVGRIKNIAVMGNKVDARFIKISIDAQKKNPKWHPAPGANSWLFLDEIIVG